MGLFDRKFNNVEKTVYVPQDDTQKVNIGAAYDYSDDEIEKMAEEEMVRTTKETEGVLKSLEGLDKNAGSLVRGGMTLEKKITISDDQAALDFLRKNTGKNQILQYTEVEAPYDLRERFTNLAKELDLTDYGLSRTGYSIYTNNGRLDSYNHRPNKEKNVQLDVTVKKYTDKYKKAEWYVICCYTFLVGPEDNPVVIEVVVDTGASYASGAVGAGNSLVDALLNINNAVFTSVEYRTKQGYTIKPPKSDDLKMTTKIEDFDKSFEDEVKCVTRSYVERNVQADTVFDGFTSSLSNQMRM